VDPRGDEIIELVRGQCLVVYTPRGHDEEIACAGKYHQCGLKDHKAMQKDDKLRCKPGWFRGVFTKKGKLMGGSCRRGPT